MHSYQMNNLKVLLADTLCEKAEGYVIEQLFVRFPSLPELLDVTEQELIAIKGIGKVKARQIVSALKLARALTVPTQTPYIIRSPQDVVNLMTPELAYLQHEEFHCLFLNTKNHVITKERISVGSLNAAIVHPREVFRAAIKRAAASFIAIHNHPSGDPTPSREDIELTKRLVEVGSITGIELLDSLVVCSHSYCSLKERNLM